MIGIAKVTVLYFASARDSAGRKREEMSIDGSPTVGALLERIVQTHPALAAMKGSIRLAVNHELVYSNASVRDGDEIAVLPPVAGG